MPKKIKRRRKFTVNHELKTFRFWKTFPLGTQKDIRLSERAARKKRQDGFYVRFSSSGKNIHAKPHAYIRKK